MREWGEREQQRTRHGAGAVGSRSCAGSPCRTCGLLRVRCAAMLLTRVRIENFRSIAACDVRLGPLTVLAGPNAAGKSNFLDALRFVRDILRSSPGQALEPRGGLEEVLHRSPRAGRPASSASAWR